MQHQNPKLNPQQKRKRLARFIREGQLSEEFLYERDNGRIVEEFG